VSAGELPRSFLYAWNLAFIGKLSEADSAKVKVSHVASLSTAAEAAQNAPSGELGLLF